MSYINDLFRAKQEEYLTASTIKRLARLFKTGLIERAAAVAAMREEGAFEAEIAAALA